ncbi:MAG: T9SS type A sorting domain-containing protein [Candidatus Zixiibacteriota bacterium]|nr:MAG: T9SS type A sorting domain-containing protein [candidate division Zixibacteria bacterium]
MRFHCLTVLLISLIALGLVAASTDARAGEWTVPDCDRISGSSAVTFTTDGGLTLAETQSSGMLFYCYGLAALDAENTLLASLVTKTGSSILRSRNAGCSWQTIASPDMDKILLFAPAPGGKAYVWAKEQKIFYLLEGTSLTTLIAPDEIFGFAVDPNDAMHIRIGSNDCQIYESVDGGANFFAVGQPANTGQTVFFTVDFSPYDWDCAMCGTKGAWRTTDAGQTWQPVEPFDLEDVDLVYKFVFSPDDPQRVLAQANLETVTNRSRDILTSTDGGVSFVSVVKQGEKVEDQNGELHQVFFKNSSPLVSVPGQPEVAYFAAGVDYQNYGTNLYRYDAGDDLLTLVHIDGIDDINVIVFNPVDPNVMYFALENDRYHLTKDGTGSREGSAQMMVAVSPNPFNPSANISFNLPNAGQVKLEVYNIKGQKVSTLVNQYLSAGDHTYSWDGSRFASGVYLYRLEAGETVRSDKMLLLK